MTPEIAEELGRIEPDTDRGVPLPLDPADVLRAISVGTRRAGARAVSVGELDEIAAEMSGPPWPAPTTETR